MTTRKAPNEMNKSKTEYAAPAIDRMLDLVEFLAEQHRPYGVSELSRVLSISTNSVFRIMKRLVERGYAEFDEESGGYSLGSGFFALGMRLSVRFDLRMKARDVLIRLSRQSGETAQIQIPDGDTMRILDTASSQTDYFLQVVPGLHVPYHCNAFGKCVLAFWTEQQRDDVLSRGLQKRTPNTITDPRALLQELDETRQTGLAYDREEHTRGLFCVGAPVFDVNGDVVAGLGLSGIVGKINAEEISHESNVLEAARQLSVAIGYTGSFYEDKIRAFA